MQRISLLLKCQKGSSILLVALVTVVLFACGALAIDVGYMYSERAKMVTVADAAAIAGARKLIVDTDAEETVANRAIAIAQANGAVKNMNSSSKIESTIGSKTQYVLEDPVDKNKITILVDLANKEVEVMVTENKGLFLSRVIDHENADIGARAKAKIGQVSGLSGLIPIGISEAYWDGIVENDPFIIKFTSSNKDDDEIGSGNYCAVDFTHHADEEADLPNIEGSEYREFLETGYPGTINVGQTIYTEPGVMVGPTRQGIASHIGDIVYAPLVETFVDVNGRSALIVVGFAKLYITEDTNNGKIVAEKIAEVTIEDIENMSWGNEDTGIWTVKLVE